MKFERDEFGRIEIVPFFHYVVRKVNLFQTRIQISLYDSSGYGYLKEKDLENYIFELMPTFPQLEQLTEPFYPFYVITSVRKFFFFLDPKRTGKIQIKDMLKTYSLMMSIIQFCKFTNMKYESKQLQQIFEGENTKE